MRVIKNRKIAIVGAARSGISAALLAQRLGAKPFVSDIIMKDDSRQILNDNNIDYEVGAHTDKIYQCDFIIKSPGIPDKLEFIKKAVRNGIKVFSEIEFAYWFSKSKKIGITGTNGKSTSTVLASHLLKSAKIKSIAAGNIGDAYSNYVDTADEDTVFSLEISSFQLDNIDTFKPEVAVILNITPDHLDRYDDKFENYVKSKFNILKNITENDIFIRNFDDKVVVDNTPEIKCKIYDFSLSQKVENGAYYEDGIIYFSNNGKKEKVIAEKDMFIKGKHNIANVLACILAVRHFGVSTRMLASGLKSFKGLEHRCEVVRELDGVTYINDSKATNVYSTYFALTSYDNPIVLFLGGREYGNDYNYLKEQISKNVKEIIAIGESKNKIFEFFKDIKPVRMIDNFDEAVRTSKEIAKKGDLVLFSPACKSFDMFKDFIHRGNEFKRLVNEL